MAAAVRQRHTRRQLEVLRAYILAGSIAGAARELDISESTARQHLSALYRRTGYQNAVQAAFRLGDGSLAALTGAAARDVDPDSLTARSRGWHA